MCVISFFFFSFFGDLDAGRDAFVSRLKVKLLLRSNDATRNGNRDNLLILPPLPFTLPSSFALSRAESPTQNGKETARPGRFIRTRSSCFVINRGCSADLRSTFNRDCTIFGPFVSNEVRKLEK